MNADEIKSKVFEASRWSDLEPAERMDEEDLARSGIKMYGAQSYFSRLRNWYEWAVEIGQGYWRPATGLEIFALEFAAGRSQMPRTSRYLKDFPDGDIRNDPEIAARMAESDWDYIDDDDPVTLVELAEQIGISKWTLLKAAREGRIPGARKSGGTWMATEYAVEQALAAGSIRSGSKSK